MIRVVVWGGGMDTQCMNSALWLEVGERGGDL